ncbi:winged helix-turn-helix domain-containing protein [Mesorhizobium sp. B2-7-2]|uniref:winged helix-turn-helix domain-containing tetratricopeptide repeat protein n=1 Tax=Mesorhizobium sp. B2-7-2 TaxID=2589908 RepID=UPI001128A623|nr:winged helix-turn-helix domain-containing protein [Mesorhizobium sp. B2-7-2]TPJ31557.1 tetratricopeptide repeat protein [Mesorhizobium sp. B2-7-2]
MAQQIGSAVLDLERGTLRRDGEIVPIRPKTFDLLAFLVRNPGRVLSKDELFEAVWPRSTVTEDSLTQCVRDVRKCLGDETQSLIRNVPRRGYIFQPADGALSISPASAAVEAIRAPEPMVAILPFRVSVADLAAKSLFDGAVEEIINALCYFKTIAVLARHSAFALAQYSDQDVWATAARLGVDFVAGGTVESFDDGYHARVVLSETASGRQVWTQAFSFKMSEIFAFQKTVARRIAAALVANIESAAMRRVSPVAAANVEAYVHILRGIALLRSYGEGVNQQARDHLLKALELDPDSGLAHAYLALADTIIGGYLSAPQSVLDQTHNRALHAIGLSPDEARCHRILALILLYRNDFEAAAQHFVRALELNPYDADTLAQTGFFHALCGNAEAGLALLDQAIQLNPMHPHWYYFDRGEALLIAGRYREAAMSFSCLPLKSVWYWGRLAACHALDGDIEKARSCAKTGSELEPSLTVEAIVADFRLVRSELQQRIRSALELAGWES